MFYLKAKIYSSEVLSPQEENRNITEKKRDQYGNTKIEDWRNKLGVPSEMDINFVHRYSYIGEKLLHI